MRLFNLLASVAVAVAVGLVMGITGGGVSQTAKAYPPPQPWVIATLGGVSDLPFTSSGTQHLDYIGDEENPTVFHVPTGDTAWADYAYIGGDFGGWHTPNQDGWQADVQVMVKFYDNDWTYAGTEYFTYNPQGWPVFGVFRYTGVYPKAFKITLQQMRDINGNFLWQDLTDEKTYTIAYDQ